MEHVTPVELVRRQFVLGRQFAHLLGVRLVSDIYERACDLGLRPPLDAKRKGRLARIRHAGVLFIHVPKNAGMSISMALYGEQVKHASMRYYARIAPGLVTVIPSFAILRDPVERFLSAYSYARAGGSGDNRVSQAFRSRYMAFRSVDEAMDHVEAARSLYEIDHIFRPQHGYVTDATGEVAVDRLLLLDEIETVADLMPRGPVTALPRLNRSRRAQVLLSAHQIDRLRRLYRRDVELFEGLQASRSAEAA